MCACVHVEVKRRELVFSSHHMDSRNQTQVIRLSNKCLLPFERIYTFYLTLSPRDKSYQLLTITISDYFLVKNSKEPHEINEQDTGGMLTYATGLLQKVMILKDITKMNSTKSRMWGILEDKEP